MTRPLDRLRTAALVAAAILAMLVPPERVAEAGGPRLRGSWWDRTPVRHSEFYAIKTDLPRDEARAFARHLDAMHREYAKRLASLPPRAPEALNVMLFRDQSDYAYTLRTRFGINATGSGGMFIVRPDFRGLALWTRANDRRLSDRRIHHVLQHEGFHQFAYSRFGGDLPLWVNEGLAEFFGQSMLVEGTLVIGQSSPRVVARVKDAIERGEHLPFRTMLAVSPEEWGRAVADGSARLQYDQAWSMVHFLVYADPDGDGDADYVDAFERYLRLLNEAVPPGAAFTRVFGDDVGAFEARWREYAMAARPTSFATALERIELLAEGMLALSERGVRPTSLDELRRALREIDYEMTVRRHGMETTVSARDDAHFEIPMDDLCRAQPAFEVSRPRLTRLTARERMLEKDNPTPPTIETVDLEPKGLRVRWVRDEDTNTFTYVIDVAR